MSEVATNPVLSVRDLQCAYIHDHPVLSIPELDIYRGELVFLLGRSGIGKSTFLEVAGAMNLPGGGITGSITYFSKGEAVDVIDLWSKDQDVISAFRRQHLSFVFQETNLMENFSAGENMLLPGLIQGGDEGVIHERVRAFMDQLGLEQKLFDQHPNRLSGGQRQRMAFIRALSGHFEVLFGDEPTGNLDPASAESLMELLRSHLQSSGKSGVLVSHDFNLASRFASRVAVITHDPDRFGTGLLDRENIFWIRAGHWVNRDREWSHEELSVRLSNLIRNQERLVKA